MARKKAVIFPLIFIPVLSLLISACHSPEQEFTTVQGTYIPLEKLKSTIWVVNYWADWCQPCWQEVQELNKLYVNDESKYLVLGVHYDNLVDVEIHQQVNAMNIHYPVLNQQSRTRFDYLKPKVLPTTYLFDSQSQSVVKTLVGPQTADDIVEHLEQLSF